MTRVLVLGNAGVDLLMPVPRLPLPGETLMAGELVRAPGGKGLNQAVVAARAGADTRFLALIGDDLDGRMVADQMATEGFLSLMLIRVRQPTDLSVVLVGPDCENSIVSSSPCADALDETTAAAFATSAGPGDILLLQGNLPLATTLTAAQAGAARGAIVVLNPAPVRWPPDQVLAHCTVVIVNQTEAAAITGTASPARAAAALRASGPQLAIVTMGAVGCLYADETGSHPMPPLPVQAVDSTGAGDAFCGMLAACFSRGWPVARSIDAAQRAAAITVSRPGAYAALPRRDELPQA